MEDVLLVLELFPVAVVILHKRVRLQQTATREKVPFHPTTRTTLETSVFVSHFGHQF